MPATSAAQERLMQAAAHTKGGYGGVSQSVGKEFVSKDAELIRGAGIMLMAPDGRVLFTKRSKDSPHPGSWDFPGGKADDNETPEQTAKRECSEEIGALPYGELKPIYHEPDSEGVEFITYLMHIKQVFTPKLEESEHTKFKWRTLDDPPKHLHPGVKKVVDAQLGTIKDPGPEKPDDIPEQDNKTANDDCRVAQDAAMAFDKASVRTYDEDGRMHVEITNISKANICPYYGREIPDEDGTLNLDPDKIYKLLRDPDELEKGASTFNNLPVLSEHVPVSAEDHKPELVVGSTGTDAVFEAPYLRNSMVIWSKEYIDGVESGDQQEISCAYRYVPDMTPGEYNGEKYDGVMRNIRGNHVALVSQGRAGPDVIVGDSLTTESKPKMSKTLSKKATMAKGALLAVLKPKMAADAMPDLDAILEGVKKSNWHVKKPGIVAAIKTHMAADADIGALVQLLDSLDVADKPAEDEQDDNLGQDDKSEGILAMLRGKISDEDLAEVEKMLKPAKTAEDEEEEDKEPMGAQDNPPPTPGTPAPPAVGTAEAPVSKTAMDAAIKAATKQAEQRTIDRLRGVSEAEKFVAPYVGELALAQDSAEGVYKAALGILGVDVAGIHPSAFKAVLAAHQKAGAVRVALDSAPSNEFASQFPDAARIRKI